MKIAASKIAALKQALRQTARRRRKDHVRDITPAGESQAAKALVRLFSGHFLTSNETTSNEDVISAYWPLAGEFDCRLLLHHLHATGCKVALPVVTGKGQPLQFRQWWPGLEMAADKFDVRVPPDSCPTLTPTIVLAPLLAFDDAGYRLGYGGGFYDRSLEALRKRGEVVAVGLAYDIQKVDKVPIDAYDQPLDWLITETTIRKFGD